MRLPTSSWIGLMIAARSHFRGGPGLSGTTLGIALSLVPVIVVLVVADGMIEGITGRFLEVDTYHARIANMGIKDSQTEEFLESVRALPQVVLAEAELRSMGLLFKDGKRAVVEVRFVSPDLMHLDLGLQRYLKIEGLFNLDEEDSVVIGREMADSIGIGVGDSIALLVQGRLRPHVLRVSGLYSSGYQQLDKAWAFMGSSAANGVSGRHFVGIKVRDPFGGLEELYADLLPLISSNMRIVSWFELRRAAYQSFRATKVWLVLIMSLIALVAVFNVSSPLRMILIERSTDLSYLRAIGGSSGQIGMVVLMIGLVNGAAGSIVGLTLGVAVSSNVNELLSILERLANGVLMLLSGKDASSYLLDRSFYLEEIPVHPDLFQLLFIAAAAIVVAVIAAVRPALMASQLHPIETLRQQ